MQVIFEGIAGDGDLGDIAIDDIKFDDGPCNLTRKSVRRLNNIYTTFDTNLKI